MIWDFFIESGGLTPEEGKFRFIRVFSFMNTAEGSHSSQKYGRVYCFSTRERLVSNSPTNENNTNVMVCACHLDMKKFYSKGAQRSYALPDKSACSLRGIDSR